jgi:hypothetical protein
VGWVNGGAGRFGIGGDILLGEEKGVEWVNTEQGAGLMMTQGEQAKLRQRFVAKAEAVFEAAMARGSGREELDLSRIEEMVEELKFELTGLLVESVIEVQKRGQAGPGPVCDRCGREMHYKGEKRREVVTSQGRIELQRPYYHCEQCQVGIFPPGPPVEDQPAGVE